MDNKNFFRALFWAVLVFLLWNAIAVRIWPPEKPPATSDAPSTGEPTLATDTPEPVITDTPSSNETASRTASAADSTALRAVGAEEAQEIVLGRTDGSAESPFRMRMVFSNIGASVESVELSDHRQSADRKDHYRLLAPVERGMFTWRSLAMEQVNIDKADQVRLDELKWKVRRADVDEGQSVEFTATVMRQDTPLLKLTRRFTLPAQPADSLRHDVGVQLEVTNLTDEPHDVIVTQRGAVGLTSEGRFTPDLKVFCAIEQAELVYFESKDFAEISKQQSIRLYPIDVHSPDKAYWLGEGNLYFTCTVCPVDASGAPDASDVSAVSAIDLDGQEDTTDDVTGRLTTRRITLSPQGGHVFRAALYLGPKDRKAFQSEANADYVERDYMLQIKDGYGSCTFNFLTDLMIRLLNWLETVFGNFGVAIIFLVIIVRVLLHPITKKTQVNMVKMQQNMSTLQPKMGELKKKYASDNQRLQQEMMKLYREEGVNPFGQMLSCLPMFLQMPIWIALYSSLRNNVAMRTRGFVFWIEDLTRPDDFITFDQPIQVPIFGWEVTAFHLLPPLVGVIMFAQQKLMPKPKNPAATPDSPQDQQAEQMQKIMPYMSLVMILLFYNFPSGLNLYILTSSLIGTLEQVYIRRHITKQDLQGPSKSKKPKKRPPGLSLFENLQKKAEEAQKLRGNRESRKKSHH